MRRVLRDNGLSLALLALFLLCWAGQIVTGWHVFNEEQVQHGAPLLPLADYLISPHFLEATAENWESEFLQMAIYVVLTALLFQRGSAESRDPDDPDKDDDCPVGPNSPAPVRHGGFRRRLYSYSLSLALVTLFLVSLGFHALGGHELARAEAFQHGDAPPRFAEYVLGSQFWFESLQNWQSEFLSVFAIVVLSIFLRHKGSPESKPVAMPNRETP